MTIVAFPDARDAQHTTSDYVLSSRLPGNVSPQMALYTHQISMDSGKGNSPSNSSSTDMLPTFSYDSYVSETSSTTSTNTTTSISGIATPTPSSSRNSVTYANGSLFSARLKKSLSLESTDDFAGPDYCSPAEHIYSTDPSTPVKIRLGRDVTSDGMVPESLPTWFARTVATHANLPALRVKRNNVWKTWTYQQYFDDVRAAAKAFIYLGLEPYQAVGIIGFNSPEWFISDLAAIYAGGLAVGIYTTNSAEAIQHNAYDSRANILVVENDAALQKVLKVRDQLPHLRAIVQYSGTPTRGTEDGVYSWKQLMALAELVPDSVLEVRHAQIAPNKCCTIIYTSGTTGKPKGAMLSHDNLIWTSRMAWKCFGERLDMSGKEQMVFVSYLPLSHVAAQMTDLFLPISIGGTVYFAQSDALKGSLVDTLREVRPHILMGVPRVWEKIAEKMQSLTKRQGPIKNWISNKAQEVGKSGATIHTTSNKNGERPFGWSLFNTIVYKKVRQSLGLDRCRITFSGAAPMMRETLEFFLSFDIPIYDVYGMSESSGPHIMSLPGEFRIGAAGKELIGVQTKINKPDAEGNGEICMYGRHIFMGYLNNEEKTQEALDDTGYLRTGDIGRKDRDGFLFITGRLKEILITAGGENVPPVPIEDNIKEALPFVGYAMVIGDKRKFLSVLLTLKTEINLDTGLPLDKLTRICSDLIEEKCGVRLWTVQEAIQNATFLKAIESSIASVNKRATSRAMSVQKFKMIPDDFSIPGGEIGPTLKLKRGFVSTKYAGIIEDLYSDSAEA